MNTDSHRVHLFWLPWEFSIWLSFILFLSTLKLTMSNDLLTTTTYHLPWWLKRAHTFASASEGSYYVILFLYWIPFKLNKMESNDFQLKKRFNRREFNCLFSSRNSFSNGKKIWFIGWEWSPAIIENCSKKKKKERINVCLPFSIIWNSTWHIGDIIVKTNKEEKNIQRQRLNKQFLPKMVIVNFIFVALGNSKMEFICSYSFSQAFSYCERNSYAIFCALSHIGALMILLCVMLPWHHALRILQWNASKAKGATKNIIMLWVRPTRASPLFFF